MHVNMVFPNQLYQATELVANGYETYLVEVDLFFTHYRFHQQKIAFHRAGMKAYQKFLEQKGITVYYIEAHSELAHTLHFYKEIERIGITDLHMVEVCDDWLNQRVQTLSAYCNIHTYSDPQFLNTPTDLASFFRADKKFFFQTTFYKQQRKKRGVLLDSNEQPLGGKWTYDGDNRKKYPKGKTPPPIYFPQTLPQWEEAVTYTQLHFSQHPGELTKTPWFPITHQQAEDWLNQFLAYRFHDFGPYEDAIVREHSLLHHSLLSPLLNAGLITPQRVLDAILNYAENHNVPINSTEGIVRQIIGWREFIRGMYLCKGRFARTRNFWGFKRKIPHSFYNGTTGIAPIDDTIKKVLKTGYCHHIERLMVLGNFMLLCEFDPDEVYQWFMELFIDAYDWVMVPNVYGMALFADGGTFATKPYIGGSNYIKKMSNYPSGDWEPIWDGLFWNFVHQHKSFFSKNPRTGMLVHSLNRMSDEKRELHLQNAKTFLAGLEVTEQRVY